MRSSPPACVQTASALPLDDIASAGWLAVCPEAEIGEPAEKLPPAGRTAASTRPPRIQVMTPLPAASMPTWGSLTAVAGAGTAWLTNVLFVPGARYAARGTFPAPTH